MKRERLGLWLLVLLLILGLLSSRRMATDSSLMAHTLDQAGILALEGDWEGVDRLVRKARGRWEGNWHLAAALTDHEPMEEVDSQLAQLEIYRQQREGLAFAALCAQISSRIEDIGDAQALNWWNLL